MIVTQTAPGELAIDAPAKINLFLEVLNKREDGYHNINSLFQAVSLYDRLNFKAESKPGVRIGLDRPCDLPLDSRNLIVRAYEMMRRKHRFKSGLAVRLEKKIPIAAGLAGGSADGAATIRACNILFDLGLSRRQMAELSVGIGSDLPFFFSTGQAVVMGRGEVVEEHALPTDYWLLLVTPRIAVSTAEAYAALKMTLTNSKEAFRLQSCRSIKELVGALRLTANDFEPSQIRFHPCLERIRDRLLQEGALLARMSGSGPTIFGLHERKPDAGSVFDLEREGWQVSQVRPVSFGE